MLSDLVPDAVKASVTLIPAEQVVLHAVALPVRGARQRQAALPFALEDAVGQPLDQTHFAVCGTGPDGRLVAAVLDVAVLAAWQATSPGQALVPEQMVLPVPDPGPDGAPVWRVCRWRDRVVVRVSDGTGFALRADMLRPLWLAAAQPRIESVGAALGPDLPWTDHKDAALPSPDSLIAADLRQGAFRPARNLGRPLRVLAATVALAGLAHLALAVLDLRAQRAIADDLRGQASAGLAAVLPDASADDAPGLILRRLTAQTRPQRGSAFVPTLDRTAQALSSLGSQVQFRQLIWDADGLRLVIEAAGEAGGLDTLQQAEALLRAAGLTVSSGSATAGDGAARAELTVRP